ncbi:MAG: TetR/AcrR family transcriptional regulator [Rhizobiales bacterium]|nr:TetR/AcrR family transcriptional regulator [Hyphomicrobiales bacterium]MBO6697491.1 TetR/AcrR family transcriptional regulator [Hyphomicrobiales bacterium]MBO6736254.1 TetR/AcrR family transcriptional regulator [Hyphomicrobiales bacterium]MBO6912724.1 TetR/AcrR family transcriptional regulator [Hyphomicrobiales bacterium]MBO6953893.1 TetR/AcrR family transcriptional regulator [Hyphomicrobiales bacterium]
MAGVQKAKREEAARKLLEAAVTCVEERGIDALHAREIAKRSGYSVGSVYKYYEDLDDIITRVNSVTLARLKAVIGVAVAEKTDPLERLKALAHAYFAFASDNRALWEALFGHRLPEGRSIPQEHRDENIALLSIIGEALLALNPDLSPEQLQERTRTCFAAVHGLVTVSVEQRFVGLSGDAFASEMDFLVERLAVAD